jgi:hypothetical protein
MARHLLFVAFALTGCAVASGSRISAPITSASSAASRGLSRIGGPAAQRVELALDEAEELGRRARATSVSVRDRRRCDELAAWRYPEAWDMPAGGSCWGRAR